MILGVEPEDDEKSIKEKYRRLMFKHHPDSVTDSDEASLEKTQKINEAYAVLRKSGKQNTGRRVKFSKWGAEIIPDAFCERTIFIAGGEYEGYKISNIPVAHGKYERDPDLEEYDMLLFSLNKLTGELLEKIERQENIYDGDTGLTDYQKKSYHMRLFHLLAQQFIDPVSCLKRVAVSDSKEDMYDIYNFRAEIKVAEESTAKREAKKLKPRDIVIPLAFDENRIMVGTGAKVILGYLTFSEDELYYVLIPILKEKLAKVKIEIPENMKQKGKGSVSYAPVNLHIRLDKEKMPEKDLNIQIRKVIMEYGSHIKKYG